MTAALVIALQLQSISFGQQFQKDASWVPESANVIAMVRMQSLLDSELGKSEKWRSKQYHSFKSGVATLPTSMSTLMIASQVDVEYLHPLWQVAVLKRDGGKIDLKKVQQRAKDLALPTQFGAYPALSVRSDAYVVQVANDTLVAMEPANRQMTSRWLAKHDDKVNVSSYLQEAIKFANTSSHFIAAIDLEDAIDVERVKIRLANSGLKLKDPGAIAEVLGKVKGVQMAIRITDKINGAFKMDFKVNPAPIAPFAKDILLGALEKNGLMIADFKDWELVTKPGSLELKGTLSNLGFNEVASFVNHPLTHGVERAIAPNQGGGDEATMAETTKMYLAAIKDYGTELMEKGGRSLDYRAKFLEKYAYQIDGMYSQNVDPIAIQFGREVSNSFREMSSTLRQKEYQRFQKQMEYGVDYERNAQANNANNPNIVVYDNWLGWTGFTSRYGKYTTERVRDQKRINNFAVKEAQLKLDAMRMDLTKQYSDVRAKLQDKYKTKF